MLLLFSNNIIINHSDIETLNYSYIKIVEENQQQVPELMERYFYTSYTSEALVMLLGRKIQHSEILKALQIFEELFNSKYFIKLLIEEKITIFDYVIDTSRTYIKTNIGDLRINQEDYETFELAMENVLLSLNCNNTVEEIVGKSED